MKITNKSEIRVANLGRSGSHAVIRWIMALASGKACFLNDAKPNKNPFLSYSGNDLKGIDKKNLYLDGNGKITEKDLLMYSYEEYPLPLAFNREFEKNHDKFVGKSKNRYDIIILRDPFNFFASRIKLEEYGIRSMHIHVVDEKTKKLMIKFWKDYAKEFLGYTSYLKNNKVVVSYNRWFADENYKKELAKKLGLKYRFVPDKFVSKYGPGSSFDGRKFDGRASQMKVMERWKLYKNIPFYRSIFKDDELMSLSKKIFGKIEGIGILLEKQGFFECLLYNLKFRLPLIIGIARYYIKKILYPIAKR